VPLEASKAEQSFIGPELPSGGTDGDLGRMLASALVASEPSVRFCQIVLKKSKVEP
jgi:hypothetical protein